MKFHLKSFIAGALSVIVLLSSLTAYAEDISKTIDVVVNKVNIAINGKVVATAGSDYILDNGEKVPNSILYKGTTYLPMRKVAELVGKYVQWDSNTNTAGISDTYVSTTNNISFKSDPNSISYAKNCTTLSVDGAFYTTDDFARVYTVVDENNEIYLRVETSDSTPSWGGLDYFINIYFGNYTFKESKNPFAEGTIMLNENRNQFVSISEEEIYQSASQKAFDTRLIYGEKEIISPSSPNYNSTDDYASIRKIYGSGNVTPMAWWLNANDMLEYFGVNMRLIYNSDGYIVIQRELTE